MRVWMTGNSLQNRPFEKTCGILYITQNKYDTFNIQHKSTLNPRSPKISQARAIGLQIAWSPLDVKWGEYGTKYAVHHGAPKTSSKKLLVTLTATCTYKYVHIRTKTYKYVHMRTSTSEWKSMPLTRSKECPVRALEFHHVKRSLQKISSKNNSPLLQQTFRYFGGKFYWQRTTWFLVTLASSCYQTTNKSTFDSKKRSAWDW